MKRREFLKMVPVGVIGGIVGGAIVLQTDDVLIMGDTHHGREMGETIKAINELAEQITRNPPASHILHSFNGDLWLDTNGDLYTYLVSPNKGGWNVITL